MKNPKGKNDERGREFTIISEDYNKFYRMMLQLQFLGFDVVIRIRPLLDEGGDIFIPSRAVSISVNILNPYNCMIHTI